MLALVCVYWNERPIYQLDALMITNILAAIIHIEVKPAPSLEENKHQFLDYLILIAILDSLFCCTDLVTLGNARYTVGYFVIFLISSSILVHLIVLASRSFKKMRLYFKYIMYVRKHHPNKMTLLAKS